ncbi:MAG: hypothetical protein FRX49_08805 [Trebouxia sp. A1-2]|nr:MAG: hypothetical protein FRX49_08805 [Trebouxia sp. A1-2]
MAFLMGHADISNYLGLHFEMSGGISHFITNMKAKTAGSWAGASMLPGPSLTVFQLYVDKLERHLLGTADNDAPTFRGVHVPLLLFVDELILMFTSAAGFW